MHNERNQILDKFGTSKYFTMWVRDRIEGGGGTWVLVTEQGGFSEKVVTEQNSKKSLYSVVFSTFFVILCTIVQ